MTHEEYLEMNNKVIKYANNNTKIEDMREIKEGLECGARISITISNSRIITIKDLDLHETVQEQMIKAINERIEILDEIL